MRIKRKIAGRITVFCVSILLALCILSGVSSAQSKDERKDRKSEEPRREEPKRGEPRRGESGDRQSSGDRATDREPVRESGERKTREQPSRSDGAGKDRSGSAERGSSRDRDPSARSGSRDKRTIPDRSTSDGTSQPERRAPPRNSGDRDYERSRDGGSAGVVPVDPIDPSVRPRRKEPAIDGGIKKKDVPVPDDRRSMIIEGWPYPPPWHPRVLWPSYQPLPSPNYDRYLIHLPFGTIRPREIEDRFLLLLDELWEDGMQDALLLCIIQTYRELDVDRFELFFDAEDEVTVYGSFTPNSFLALISVYSIYELMNDPRVRWIGEYKPFYKINDSVRLWEYDGVFVFPLEDDSIEFREDLEDIHLSPEFYDTELGFYFVPAEDYELEAISEFWWVAEVLRVVSDPDHAYDYGYRTYE